MTLSQILIVGAMVVGPEYGAILSLAFGVTRRDWSPVRRSAAALVIGFALAVVAALLLALIIRGAGLTPRAYLLGVRPVSNLIDTSDAGVSLAFNNGSEARGSILQLLLNVIALTLVAIAGLPLCEHLDGYVGAGQAKPNDE